MKNWKTTLLGLGEAVMLELTAESLFDLTWEQRRLVLGMGILRACFGYFARDKEQAK